MRTYSSMCMSESKSDWNLIRPVERVSLAARPRRSSLARKRTKESECLCVGLSVHPSHSSLPRTKIKPALSQMLALMMWKNWGAGDDWFGSDSASGGMPIRLRRRPPSRSWTTNFLVLTTCCVRRTHFHQHCSSAIERLNWDEWHRGGRPIWLAPRWTRLATCHLGRCAPCFLFCAKFCCEQIVYLWKAILFQWEKSTNQFKQL
jgi:hypothetical protein